MEEFTNPFRSDVVIDPSNRIRIRRFRRRRRRFLIVVALALMLGTPLGVLTAKPAFRAFKNWRSTRLVSEAREAVVRGQIAEALSKAHAAYLLVPNHYENLRLVADICLNQRSERASEFWLRVVNLRPENQENRRYLIESALVFDQLALASIHAEELLKLDADSGVNLVLAARVARAGLDYTRELGLLRRAKQQAPADPEVEFLLQRATVDVATGETSNQAMTALREMATSPDRVGVMALAELAKRPLPLQERLDFAAKIKQNPAHTREDWLQASGVILTLQPGARGAVLRELRELYDNLESCSVDDLITLAAWLNSFGEFEQLMELIPRNQIGKAEPLTHLYLDALVGLGRPAEIREILSDRLVTLQPEFQAFYRWQEGQIIVPDRRNLAERGAREALELAMNRPRSLSLMAARFEALRQTDLAVVTYNRLLFSPAYRSVAMSSLLRIAYQRRQTTAVLALLEESLRLSPGDPWIQNDVAYYQLLLGKSLKENHAIAKKLVHDFPDRVTYRGTLSLALLRLEFDSQVLMPFEQIAFDWERVNAATCAVYAAALRVSGRIEEAEAVKRALRNAPLLPEQKDLLRGVKLPPPIISVPTPAPASVGPA